MILFARRQHSYQHKVEVEQKRCNEMDRIVKKTKDLCPCTVYDIGTTCFAALPITPVFDSLIGKDSIGDSWLLSDHALIVSDTSLLTLHFGQSSSHTFAMLPCFGDFKDKEVLHRG